MGNLVKINTYIERKRVSYKLINIKVLGENLKDYNNWLKKTNREDRLETYKEFLQVQ